MQDFRINIMAGLLFSCSLSLFGQGEISDWVLEKEEDEIKISYRKVELPGKPEVREMKAEFLVKAAIPDILEHFRSPAKLIKWQTSTEECTIKELEPEQWRTYLRFDLPWPFRSKDLVTHNSLRKGAGTATITARSTPNALPQKNKTDRILSLECQWSFRSAGEEGTKVIYTSISYDEPEFPRFIADPVVQRRILKNFGLLRENAEKEAVEE
ncbi:hypothetical protein [Salinimicrobium soli]|uniref:hypothetical protein n=1 Tax=Salinimicrobium soli TaxID=1254399 RepID=UPI003AAF1413